MKGTYLASRKETVNGSDKLKVNGTKNIEVTGNQDEKVGGSYTLDVTGEYNLSSAGSMIETKFALFEGLTVGAWTSAQLAATLELFVGLKASITAAVNIEVDPVKMKFKGLENSALGVKLEAMGNKLKTHGIDLSVSGLTVKT